MEEATYDDLFNDRGCALARSAGWRARGPDTTGRRHRQIAAGFTLGVGHADDIQVIELLMPKQEKAATYRPLNPRPSRFRYRTTEEWGA